MSTPNIIIIGGGLSGLTTAYLLKKEDIPTLLLEARPRLGGRIHTVRNNGEPPIEMGATWLGKKHTHLLSLLDELNIDIYEQFMGQKGYYEPMSVSPPQLVDLPPNEEPSYRIQGGSQKLVKKLAEGLDDEHVRLNQAVASIQENDHTLTVKTESDSFEADLVITTLPPKLLVESISFTPSLPEKLLQTAMQTHTWMAESIKIGLTFEKAFWQESDSSGTIFSNVGPVNEMYDHSDQQQSRYALKGFMNDAYHSVSRERRKQLVLNQLHRFYGDQVHDFTSYYEKVWRNDSLSYSDYEQHIIPHQNNGAPVFQKPYWDNRLWVSGSETASDFPGYMDGAVQSAKRVVKQFKGQR